MSAADRERRSAVELRAAGNRLAGYAAVFGSLSADLGGFRERIAYGAFTRALAAAPDVVALFDHDRRSVLGRTLSGTLRLREDARGLAFEIDAPQTSIGRDVLEMVGRGDVTGASFSFAARAEQWSGQGVDTVRELTDLDLFDVTVTPTPAYPDASVARRHMPSGVPVFRLYAARALDIMGRR